MAFKIFAPGMTTFKISAPGGHSLENVVTGGRENFKI